MGILHTATFTLSISDASDDQLDAVAAAFTCTLHRAGRTPSDAMLAWQRMDDWERCGFTPDADPGPLWRRTMAIARDAVTAGLQAGGFEGQQRPFVIQSAPRHH